MELYCISFNFESMAMALAMNPIIFLQRICFDAAVTKASVTFLFSSDSFILSISSFRCLMDLLMLLESE